MNTLLGIVSAPLIIAFFFWWTFGGKDRRPTYWACTAGHAHQTPAAARKCSIAQRRG
jgi:hypothetical protein